MERVIKWTCPIRVCNKGVSNLEQIFADLGHIWSQYKRGEEPEELKEVLAFINERPAGELFTKDVYDRGGTLWITLGISKEFRELLKKLRPFIPPLGYQPEDP